MRKIIAIAISSLLIILTGCSNSNLTMSSSKPPELNVVIESKEYGTVLGTYCWNEGCVDTIGPVEMLSNSKAIEVSAGQLIELKLKGDTSNTDFHLALFTDSQNSIEVPLVDFSFNAPNEPGVYYYSNGIWWNGPKLSGDAFYAFKIEVK